MDVVIIILGILYLKGYDVGNALAICSIVEGALVLLSSILDRLAGD